MERFRLRTAKNMKLLQWLQPPRAFGLDDGFKALQDDGHHRIPQVRSRGRKTVRKDEAHGCGSSGNVGVFLYVTFIKIKNIQPKNFRGLEKQPFWSI